MRVIAGKYKKSNLFTLEGNETRPSKDMLKEALFSSINIHNEIIFLDLFSGSGAIGIEALSRGAKDVIFNDNNKEAYKIIKMNLDKFNEDRIIYNLDYEDCLNKVKDYKFDYIFLDPPYNFNNKEEIIKKISDLNIQDINSMIIFETDNNNFFNERINDYELIKEKKYGKSKLSYFIKK